MDHKKKSQFNYCGPHHFSHLPEKAHWTQWSGTGRNGILPLGRTQCVSINGVLSELKELECGVPQGSVLGPIEFCIYTIPLGAILKYHKINYHIYADDTQIYCSFKIDSLDEVQSQ